MPDLGLDITVPNVARIYDYILGGKDNFTADREAAEKVIQAIPGGVAACRLNRAFLGRVVTHLVTRAGISQFLDIGSGLPTTRNVHEIASDLDPAARTVYVDYDPMVISHARAILAQDARVAVVQADVRNPQDITGSPPAREVIDFTRPVAILMFAILHFITDDECPARIVGHFRDLIAPGSYLALSHITADHMHHADSHAAQQIYHGASAPVVPRTRRQILRLLDGLQLTSPGLVNIADWPAPPPDHTPPAPTLFYGGMAERRN